MAGKNKGKSRRKSGKSKALIAVFATVAIIVAGFFSVLWLIDNRFPAFTRDGVIKVYPGMSETDLLRQIEEQLAPKYPSSIKRVLALEKLDGKCVPGMYRFKSDVTARFLARALKYGWDNPTKLVISGNLRSKEAIAQKISAQMMIDSASLMTAFNDEKLLKKYGTSPSSLFEFILPDTYEVYWTEGIDELLGRLKKEHDAFWTEERVAAANKQGLTPYQVSVLASIVAQESNRKDEYPKIASVYLTRLRKGMKLQACPTVCYIYDYSIKRVLKRHLANPSLYNTYMYEGLPPTPICVPGKDCIEAVLHPDETPYLYFCADSSFSGRNVFSRTYAEHARKASEYHQAYDKMMGKKAKVENGKDS